MVLDCITQLQKIEGIEDAEIVIVDNASPDGTGQKLKDYYLEHPYISVILNKENIGFAKGNNIGYKFAKNNLGCDVIVVMNDDVMIYDKNFIRQLECVVVENPDTAIIAPDIIDVKRNKHTNPCRVNKPGNKEIHKMLIKYYVSLIFLHLNINYYKLKKDVKINNIDEKQIRINNVMPHGPCIIYCPKWIKNEEKAFYSGTFLYAEEYCLYSYSLFSNNRVDYIPSLVVSHLAEGTVDKDNKTEKKRRLFRYRNQLKSMKQYLRFDRDIERYWNEE